MSTSIKDAQKTVSDDQQQIEYTTEDGSPNTALLQDRSPEWMRFTYPTLALIVVLGALFTYLNYFIPLSHTDLWGHLTYGRLIVENGLPDTEPLMPLSVGINFVDTAWLSQVIGFFAYDLGGPLALKAIYSFLILSVAAMLAFKVLNRTHNLLAACLTIAAFYWVNYQQLLIIRPQLGGLVCFCVLLMMATSVQWKSYFTWMTPLLFAVWANLHGSFPVGIVVLGAFLVGHAIDLRRRTKSWKAVFADERIKRLFMAIELATVAVLANPYGIGLYAEVFAISGNPNFQNLIEWDPLTIRMKQGQAAAVIGLALIALYRVTPRRITASELLTLVGLGMGMLWYSRMIIWWAPVAAYYLGLHFAAWRRQIRGWPQVSEGRGANFIAALGLIWIFLAISPAASVVKKGKPADAESLQTALKKVASTATPIDIAAYLKENPPQGQVFNTYEWGDYLLWAGPKNLQVFVASHAHLIPEEVWTDYMEIQSGSSNWSSKLDRYGVNTVVLDNARHRDFIKALSERPEDWEKAFANTNGAVFVRKQPI